MAVFYSKYLFDIYHPNLFDCTTADTETYERFYSDNLGYELAS